MVSKIILGVLCGGACVAYLTYNIIKIVKIKKGTWKKGKKKEEVEDE